MFQSLWFKVLLIITLGVTAYSFMLGAPFKTMDDQYSIVSNPLIKNTGHIKELFTRGYFNDRSYYRPLVNLSFMGEYHAFGLKAFYYNLDNLLIHLLNAFLVWIVAGLILGNMSLGFWAGLLFVIHPIHCEAVGNISGRAILLSASFVLTAFICFLLLLKHKKLGFLLASLLSFTLGLFCKESSAVFPGVIFLYLWIVDRTKIKIIWPWATILGVYLVLRHYLDITQTLPWRNISECLLGFATFLRSILTDIQLFLFPVGLHFDRSQRVFLSVHEAEFLMTMFIWAVLIVWLLAGRKHIKPLIWFCMGWIALELLPVSQLVTSLGVSPGRISSADHFLYMASVPLFIIVIHVLSNFKWIHSLLSKIILASLLGFFFLMNIEQNIYASNELSMMERSIFYEPHNARIQSSVGLIYATQGKIEQARKHFIVALAQEPWNPRYRISLAKTICDQGKYEECLELYSQIDNPGPFAKLLEDNKAAAKRLLEQQQKP